MQCPTLNEIRVALFNVAQNALEHELESGLVYFVAPNQGNLPDKKCILVLTSFTPGTVNRIELGGSGAMGTRNGIFKITISALPDEDADVAWEIAEKLEEAFKPFSYESLLISPASEDSVNAVYCDFPYSENIGIGVHEHAKMTHFER